MNLADVSCKLAKLFVSAGADLNALNKEGQTPLMIAVLQVYTSFVLFLLLITADPPLSLNPLCFILFRRSMELTWLRG